MNNRPNQRSNRPGAFRPPVQVPFREPPVRCWPHTPGEAGSSREAELHFLRCSLSYQNETLAEIKALLQGLAEQRSEPPKGTG